MGREDKIAGSDDMMTRAAGLFRRLLNPFVLDMSDVFNDDFGYALFRFWNRVNISNCTFTCRFASKRGYWYGSMSFCTLLLSVG